MSDVRRAQVSGPSTSRARYYPLTSAAISAGIEPLTEWSEVSDSECLAEWLGISYSESAEIGDFIVHASERSKAQTIDCESFDANSLLVMNGKLDKYLERKRNVRFKDTGFKYEVISVGVEDGVPHVEFNLVRRDEETR